MTRGVLWGGTLLLYATFAYGVGPKGLGGLATTSTIVGIPIMAVAGAWVPEPYASRLVVELEEVVIEWRNVRIVNLVIRHCLQCLPVRS